MPNLPKNLRITSLTVLKDYFESKWPHDKYPEELKVTERQFGEYRGLFPDRTRPEPVRTHLLYRGVKLSV